GAYGGRADLMDHMSPVGPIYQAGTLSGNPLAMASGLATLTELKLSPPYERLERLSRRLADGLSQAAVNAGVPHTVARVGSMLTLFFNPEPVVDYAVALESDAKMYGRFFWKMMQREVYLPCSQFEALFVSDAHTMQDVDRTVAAAAESLRELVDEGPAA
ncbi:MAG: aminotransferase class III-fold pyridoxal phosphate-dependent enzyme, partial [Planctomycetia bacterium]